MIDVDKYAHVLFDGECGVCTYFSEIAKKMDREKRFAIEPYQLVPEGELMKFGLTYDKCARRLYVISRRGRVYPGALGVNYFFFHHFPWSVLVALAYLVPVFLLLEIIGYSVVAKHRHRISRWFGFKACLATTPPARERAHL